MKKISDKIKNKKIVIITGGLGFLGVQHAEAILESGNVPILIDVNMKNSSHVKKYFKKNFNYSINIINCNITKITQVKNLKNKILSKFDKIDALINNASVNYTSEDLKKKLVTNWNIDAWKRDLNVGLTGSMICSMIFGEEMNKNKNGGVIINISSDLGLISPDQRLYINKNRKSIKPASYSAVKHGLIGLTKYFATYWPNKKLRVNALCPGGMKNKTDKNFLKKIKKLIPLRRLASYGEYKGAINFLLSEEASYMNGSSLIIDGGRTII